MDVCYPSDSRHVPVLTQISSMFGQLGQLASAVALVKILAYEGWTSSFLTVAAVAIVATICSAAVINDSPTGQVTRSDVRLSRQDLRIVVRNPEAWLGFFVYMSGASTCLMFALMWGYNYLEQGQARTPQQASGFFTVLVISSLIVSSIIGVFTSRVGNHRSELALIGNSPTSWRAALSCTLPVICLSVLGIRGARAKALSVR